MYLQCNKFTAHLGTPPRKLFENHCLKASPQLSMFGVPLFVEFFTPRVHSTLGKSGRHVGITHDRYQSLNQRLGAFLLLETNLY